MMYNNKLAIAIKSNGKVLREFGDQVYVPFGSEYSLFIKNMNTVRALVSVQIDGEDVDGDGGGFVVSPNDSLDIERFIQNGNLSEGNRFKFIERTGAVENHRGIGVEDGLIRVEFKYEKVIQPDWYVSNYRYGKRGGPYDDILRGTKRAAFGSATDTIITTSSATFNADAPIASYTASVQDAEAHTAFVNQVENDVGVTVEGSISDQQFRTVASFPTEVETHVIILKILGQTKDNVQVSKPVTVDRRPVCTSCGRKNKATAKFCTECGTSLQIVA